MFTKYLLIGAFAGMSLTPLVSAQNPVTNVGTSSITTPFEDGGGATLPTGSLVQVGYFNGVASAVDVTTFGTAQWNTFKPISGLDSPNPHLVTNLGAPGLFTFVVTWEPSAGDVVPPNFDYRLGLKIFNGPDEANSTHYNLVTSNNSSWLLPGLSFPPPTGPILTLDPPSPNTHFMGTDFVTDISIAPEPSSTLLALLGLGLLLRRRR